jgi:CubicO group peptidase (beta-lactamase class C family)
LTIAGRPEIGGKCDPEFSAIAETFAGNIGEVRDGGAAFAVVLNGALVVDLWTGRAGADPWKPETRCVLMSATKGIAVTAIARLVERGLVDVDRPVAEYWPDFAAAGKAEVSLAHVLSHAAGLITVPDYADLLSPEGRGWNRTEEIIRRLASAAPEWTPGTAHGYHGLTIGWILNEVARRITGQSIATIVREEIAGPLGLELDIGTPPQHQALVAPVVMPADPGSLEQLVGVSRDPLTPAGRMAFAADGKSFLSEADRFFSNSAALTMELPAVNGTGTARSLARVYGTLALGEASDRVTLLSRKTLDIFTAETARGTDIVTRDERRWGLGFQLLVPRPPDDLAYRGPHVESFGHDGYGGQLGLADPVSRLGIGFIRNSLSASSPLCSRLINTLYSCLES